MRLPLLLAWRFLKSSHEQTISTMLRICFLSIVIGTGSLTLIAAIMNGFEKATHSKLQGVHADITISSGGQNINDTKLSELLKKKYPAVQASSPSSMHHVMLEIKKDADTYESSICLLRAVAPTREQLVTTLGSHFIDTTWDELTSESILIGQTLARRLAVSKGAHITLLYHTQEDELLKKEVQIAGLFNTGIHDYDEQVVIASYALVDQLYPHRVMQVCCSLTKSADAPQVIASLTEELGLEVHSWKDLYTPLVAALTLEKYAMWLILLLVTLVSSLTIVSLLYMYATHKKTDIALLTSMGMPSFELKKVFLCIASIITFSATACGIALASLGTWLLNTYPFITLPDVYYVTHLPAELTLSIIAAVILIAFLVSLCAGLFPNARISSLSNVLKGMI